jgi:superfamily II DNA or RNA helicase
MTIQSSIAPGARILCRDAEWLVKSTSRSNDGGRVIEAIGVSEFIRGRSVQFIEELETDLEVLQPEHTNLVADRSGGYVHSLLFIESHLRQTVPEDGKIYVGQQAAMDVMDYQLYPAYKSLAAPRQRILIADAVGLGKTLECGILVSELIRRDRGKRILVVTNKSMMVQFQKEFWVRFTIPLVRLDSGTIQRIRLQIPGNHNPFHYYDRTIISIDTLKQDREYRVYLEQAHWDIIVIDEAHNVAKRGQGASQRAKLAERLANRSDTLILLSATPHDGRPESFASLMNMLDPTAIADESDYTKEDIRDLYVRRFKKDVLRDLRQSIPERQVASVEAQASEIEERVFRALENLQLGGIDGNRKGKQLFKTTLLKSFLSSPAACLETVNNRLKLLRGSVNSADPDLHELTELGQILAQVSIEQFSKYQRLLKLVQTDFKWNGKDPQDRLVIFTSRLASLRLLKQRLPIDLQLKPEAIEVLDGSMPDTDQNRVVEAFGQENSKVRILLATEVASEGLNLHYLSHKLIHFDIPWSLMTLQQRNGRIDRYGQTRAPQIRYLLTRSQLERMDEVERIIKVLLNKDEQAIKNIGDPSVFMGVFDAQAEEEYTARSIESGVSAAEFEAQLETNAAKGGDFDIFAWFENPDDGSLNAAEETVASPKVEQGKSLSLYPSTYDYAATALQAFETPIPNLNIQPAERSIELQIPTELERRYRRLPPEIRPSDKQLLQLNDRPNAIMQAWEEARRLETSFPQQQYLWDLHPLVEWLKDRGLFRFGRHQAPAIELNSGLAEGESVFILWGSFANQRGKTLMNRWLGVVFKGSKFDRIETLDTTVQRTRLGKTEIPNPGELDPLVVKELEGLRAEAVRKSIAHLTQARAEFLQQLTPQLEEQRDRLSRLKSNHSRQLQLKFDKDTPTTATEQRRHQEEQRLDRVFQEYENWVDLSMTIEEYPYLKLVAVLRGVGSCH